MNTQYNNLGWWSGIAFFITWGSGLALTGWIVPLPPSFDAVTVSVLLQDRAFFILLGVAIMTVTALLYLPWTVLLSNLILRINSSFSMLSKTQLVAGLMAQVTFFIPPYMWAVAAYRPHRDPEITQAFVDAGWLIFITGIGPFILQYAALAIAIFSDKRETPVFPRWIGYLQIWISISFLPAILPFFIKEGPFAWDGILVWWLPLSVFVGWFLCMITLSKKAMIFLSEEKSS